MQLTLYREPSVNGATLSRLFQGAEFICDVLEDEIREIPGVPVSEWKIYGVTAIPSGSYRLALVDSQRFGPDTLSVENVEGYDGVRIHGGNTATNTLGCLLPGTRNSSCTVAGSQNALLKLRNLVVPILEGGGEVILDIVNP